MHPAVRAWFEGTYREPTPVQRAAFALAPEAHVLMSSPTASGKTVAAFLPVVSGLHEAHDAGALLDGIACLYVSPLKALAVDVVRNVRAMVEGVADVRRASGEVPPTLRVEARSGDTPDSGRRRQALAPPHVLAVTPETLAILLNAPRLRLALARVKHVVVDELHAFAGTRRGAHLALSLERLESLVVRAGGAPPRRVGLSATVEPPEDAARLLVGARPVHVVAARDERPLGLLLESPAPDPLKATLRETEEGVLRIIRDRMSRYATTLVFTNTRALAERLAAGLRDAGAPIEWGDALDPEFDAPGDGLVEVAAHHGSLSRDLRIVAEERLKRGELRCIVASASLELGIDVGAVEHVVLVGNPRDAARALQRVGRSGRGPGASRSATLVPLDPEDLSECVALAHAMARHDIEPLAATPPALDVLAQHMVGLALEAPFVVEDLLRLAHASGPYASLAAEDVHALADALEVEGLLARRGARLVRGHAATLQRYAMGVGAIATTRRVRVLHGDRFVGDVDEAFALSLGPGDVFGLGGLPWRFVRAGASLIHVTAAPGAEASVPAWGAEGLPASRRLVAATHGRPDAQINQGFVVTPETLSAIGAWGRLLDKALGPPKAKVVPAETFLHDDGRRGFVVHARLGRRTHQALGLALAATVDGAQPVVSDHGFGVLTPRAVRLDARAFDRLTEDAVAEAARSAVFASERAKRRRRAVEERMFLLRGLDPFARRLRADHEVVAWDVERELARDVLDVEGASGFLHSLRSGALALQVHRLARASPLAACVLHAGDPFSREGRLAAIVAAVEDAQDAAMETSRMR